jgi:hypothetical protein
MRGRRIVFPNFHPARCDVEIPACDCDKLDLGYSHGPLAANPQ